LLSYVTLQNRRIATARYTLRQVIEGARADAAMVEILAEELRRSA
jgi:hypothetical protein